MSVVTIKLSEIEVDKARNVRGANNYGDLDALAKSIENDGQLVPVLVGPPNGGGKFTLVAGFRRIAAIQKLKRQKGSEDYAVLANVISDKKADQDWINILENVARNNLSSYEQAAGFAKMVDDHKWTPQEIASRFGTAKDGDKIRGMSRENISNLVAAFKSLSDSSKEAWSKGQLTNEAVFKLRSYEQKEQDVVLPYVKGKSGGALLDAINEYEGGTGQGSAKATKGKGAKGEKGARKPGGVAVRSALAWAEENKLEQISIALEWLLGNTATMRVGELTFSHKKNKKAKKVKKAAKAKK